MRAHRHTHAALAPQDMVKVPTDSQNTNTLRHMTHPLTSSTTKDLQSFTHVKMATDLTGAAAAHMRDRFKL